MTLRLAAVFAAASVALLARGAYQLGRGLWEMTHESWVRL